ncbi:MAG: hypothetical protein D8H92_15275 [Campylobacter sp.]|nr:MAG: hypothetical protein D8H92_15275 [Campylobacter sp.]
MPSAKIKNKLAKFIKIYAYQIKRRPTLSSNLAKPNRRDELILGCRKPKNGFKAQKRFFLQIKRLVAAPKIRQNAHKRSTK